MVQAVLDDPDCPVDKDALELAIASGSVEVTRLVGCKHEFPKDDFKRTVVVDGFMKAASEGTLGMVECLWEWVYHNDLEILGKAMKKSAKNGHFAVAETLGKFYVDGFDPDEDVDDVIWSYFPSSSAVKQKRSDDEAEYRASLGEDEYFDDIAYF
ncbi:unnamed protein product [Ectocarpus fasciculatus]